MTSIRNFCGNKSFVIAINVRAEFVREIWFRCMMMHRINRAAAVTSSLEKKKTNSNVAPPPSSPGLVPCNYCLSSRPQITTKGKRYDNIGDTRKAVTSSLKVTRIPQKDVQRLYDALVSR